MPDPRVLVVDDEQSMRDLLAIMLRQTGFEVSVADGGETAVERLKTETFDLVVTDLRMRKLDGLAVLKAAKEHSPRTVVLVVTAYASTETAVEAMKLGAYDYITKPFKLDELKVTVANALERRRLQEENLALKRQLHRERGFENFVGRSPKILDVFETIRFVSVNCGAVPETLMESELFGHIKGAFTGAVANSEGLFAAADSGTLFLDEITEIPQTIQVKLLRAIQERQIRRVGDTKDVKIDVRLIAASNRDLGRALTDGLLREDLFYRLNVIPIHLPPLRDRREDIPLLVAYFIKKLSRSVGRNVGGVAPEAMATLEQYHWPGNIRELENVVERAIVLGSGEVLEADALPPTLRQPRDRQDVLLELPAAGIDLEAALDRIEHRYMQLALERVGGVQTRAAELLRVSFRQFRYKLQKHTTRSST
jgi:two-component system response regulator PilR (NtrC family)